jgi:hypothetical protein
MFREMLQRPLRRRRAGGRLGIFVLIGSLLFINLAASCAGEEFPRHPAGLVLASPEVIAGIPRSTVPDSLTPLPSATTWWKYMFPPPQNQGTTQGSCVAWAVAYAVKTFTQFGQYGEPVSTPDHQFSPSFVYDSLNTDPSCKAGLTLPQALQFVERYGVATLDQVKYDPSSCLLSAITAQAKQSALNNHIVQYQTVVISSPVILKAYIAAGQPVLLAIKVDQKFEDWYAGAPGHPDVSKNYAPAQPPSFLMGDNNQLLAHAVVAVGYDDNHDGGAFRVMNSWGSDWGDGGFVWISYSGLMTMVFDEAYVVSDIFRPPLSQPAANLVSAAGAPSQSPATNNVTAATAPSPPASIGTTAMATTNGSSPGPASAAAPLIPAVLNVTSSPRSAANATPVSAEGAAPVIAAIVAPAGVKEKVATATTASPPAASALISSFDVVTTATGNIAVVGLSGYIAGASGHVAQIIVSFEARDGTPVRATSGEPRYTTGLGFAAGGIDQFQVNADPFRLEPIKTMVPVSAMNIQNKNGAPDDSVVPVARIYIDNSLAAEARGPVTKVK